ncbi:hypothetical protein K7432_017488 [Basidiobolus ranarum]|uniref:SSUH2-like protein n=1 Tax=Basidiobolus ranarum TaxID=34480 RepID=A0ABR2VLL1_9FUNG
MNDTSQEPIPYSSLHPEKLSKTQIALNPLPFGLDDATIRETLLIYANLHATYSADPAHSGHISSIERNDIVCVKLKTFIEVREMVRKSIPFSLSQPVVCDNSNPQNVNIWTIEVKPPDFESFKACESEVELPNTSQITGCILCSGNGYRACAKCRGTGRKFCTSCNGSGTCLTSYGSIDSNNMEPRRHICSACSGKQYLLCVECDHTGRSICADCGGSCYMRTCTYVVARFQVRENSRIVAQNMADFKLWQKHCNRFHSDLWSESYRDSTTILGYEESRYLPVPFIQPVKIESIPLAYNSNLESEGLLGTTFDFKDLSDKVTTACDQVINASNSRNHVAGLQYERVLAQQLSVDVIPLSKICLEYKQKTFKFWMYGARWEYITTMNAYPKKIWSHCCSIL